jgi:hypothetical protein
MNPHTHKWTPMLGIGVLNGFLNFQNIIAGVKTHCLEKKHYITETLLKRRCLKWARIAHLDVWNTNYGQKKVRSQNWQFDSLPLKVENRRNVLACRRWATYLWKALNKGYNFTLNLIAIEGLHAKLCASKVMKVLSVGILGPPLESLETKSHLDVAPLGEAQSIL